MALETMSAAQERLAAVGFGDQLVVDDTGLRAAGSDHHFDPAELVVVETVRFEGETDPADEAILFALTSAAGEPVGTYAAAYGPNVDPVEARIMERLHEPPLSEKEVRAHREHDHVAAVFPRRSLAEEAVDELRASGLGSDELGVAVHGPGHAAFERDAEQELGHDVEAGAATGALMGFLSGFAIMAVAVPGIGTIGVGGLLALGAASGFGGAMFGGYAGIAAGDRTVTVHEHLAAEPLQPDEVLVAVCSHGHPATVEQIMRRHGGRLVPTP